MGRTDKDQLPSYSGSYRMEVVNWVVSGQLVGFVSGQLVGFVSGQLGI